MSASVPLDAWHSPQNMIMFNPSLHFSGNAEPDADTEHWNGKTQYVSEYGHMVWTQ